MGRNQTNLTNADAAFPERRYRRPGTVGNWRHPYYNDWGEVVGTRVRRLRHERGWTLADLARAINKPEGGGYSTSYFSRLERGWTSGPLYVYIHAAAQLGVRPGLLLGADDIQKDLSPGEEALLRFLERMEIAPVEAIVRLAGTASEG